MRDLYIKLYLREIKVMFPISIDTSALTFSSFLIPGQTDFLDGAVSPTIMLPTGTYSFQQASGYFADFQFEVTPTGTLNYDVKFDTFLNGRDTSTLKINGFAITLDSTALSHGLYPIIAGNSSFLMPNTVHTLVLVPASFYNFQPGSGFIANFFFGVDLNGNVVVDSKFSGFAEGTGTNRLTIRGYVIQFDGRRLTHRLLPLIARPNNDFLPPTSINSLTLIPADGYGFQPGSGIVADMFFSVGLDGLVDYPISCDGFLQGRGSAVLTLLGYPVLIDATQADSDLVGLVDIGQNAQAPRFLLGVLLPCNSYRLQTRNGVFSKNFVLERNGRVTVDAAVAGRMVISTAPRVEVIGTTPI
jgi:hypothetical protein